MRRVRFRTLDAGPDGVRQPGSVHALPALEAQALVDGGYASYVDGGPVRAQPLPPAIETATRPAAPETAATRVQTSAEPARGRRR